MFDKLLLISCICIVIALILYFFHWNRLIGFLIGRAIRFMYWREDASSIWVEIGSIHFSMIAGRILFKDVGYHSSNQTIRIVKGEVQWRYWIRRPTTENDIGLRGGEDRQFPPAMQCRIQVSLQGFEWYLYNRTSAFDNIIAQMEANNPSRPVSRNTDRGHSFQKLSRQTLTSPFYPPSSAQLSHRLPQPVRKVVAWVKRQLPSLDPKDLLPVGIGVTKGAITCGNNSTPNLLVVEFQASEGTFGIIEARSRLDLYKQLFSMKFQHTIIRYIDNENFADPMASMGGLVHGRILQYSTLNRPSSYLSYRSFLKLWDRLGLLALARKYTLDRWDIHVMQKQRTAHPPRKSYKNLDDATPIGADFTQFEYAIERKILETPVLELSYYFDVVGEVPALSEYHTSIEIEATDNGNQDVSPEWGFDITISGGVIRYGPWADRQRAELQRAFFPPTYRDGDITSPLKPGDKRLWTALRVFVELRDNTVLHTPFREPSKDWQWDEKPDIPLRQRAREAAEIQITVGDRSTISYMLPMVTSPSGYQPVLEVHLDTISITSSLNDIRLVTAESCRVHCELPTPLKWNMERKWIVSLTLRQPVLYLIRDHINMFIDIGKDWMTGPPSDYQCFIPMIYSFVLELHHYELNMYANDHNIIDKPLIRDENTLLTLHGAILTVKADVLSNNFRPESTTIPFWIDLPDVSLNLSLPRWNTNALYAPKAGNSLASVRTFCVDGSYQYFSEVREEYVEQLKLDFKLREVAFKNLGWSIRYFMILKDNYFGSFTHFSTLYEYLNRIKRNQPLGDPILSKYRPGKNNMLQAEIHFDAACCTIIMPTGLPGYSSGSLEQSSHIGIGECLIVTLPRLQLHFRMHDHYMEMSLNIGEIIGNIISSYPEEVTYRKSAIQGMKKIIHIDGLDITANRLFGPQPRTATYVCIWEISLGSINSLLSTVESRLLTAAGDAFRLNYLDFLNAPAAQHLTPVDPDVTFVKFCLKSLDVTWRAGRAACTIALRHGIRFDSNDLGGRYHRKVTSLRIEDISVKVLLNTSCGSRWLEAGELLGDSYLDVYSAPRGFREISQNQITYIGEQDQTTGRARRLISSLGWKSTPETLISSHKNGLFLPHPALPSRRDCGPTPTNAMPSAPNRNSWTNLAQPSESDAEERVSDADRDARLAQTRSSTPLPQFTHDDNRNMSSGDESDDEDLTDGSSDSDWSNFDDPDHSDNNQWILRHYSHVIRHYVARFLTSPELWEGSPFFLVKDRARLDSPQSNSSGQSMGSDEPTEYIPQQVDKDDHDITSLRFRGRKSLDIKITPLLLQAAIYFEEDMRNSPLCPELCIDAMMASHLGNMTSSNSSSSCVLFEASIASVTVQVLQRLVMADGHPAISQDISGTEDPSMLDVIVVFQAGVKGVSATGTLKQHSRVINVRTSRLSLMLDLSVDKKTIKTPSSDEFVFSYVIDELKTSIDQDSLLVGWNQSTIRIGHFGPEYIVATGAALTCTVQELSDLNQRRKQHSSTLKQTIIADITRNTMGKPTVDPLSTIQPSYLVQSGIPHALRTDVTFRFLYHLRNCLWHLEKDELLSFCSFRNDNQSVDMEELMALLESRLIALDPDSYNVSQMSSLEPLFSIMHVYGPSPVTPPFEGSPASRSFSLNFAKIAFVVLDPTNTSHSELVVTDVNTNARLLAGDILQLPTSLLTSMSQTSLHSPRILKMSALVSVGDVTLSVFPHLMGFAQQVLRVRRYYASLQPPALPPSSTPSNGNVLKARRAISYNIILSLRHLRIQAAAENLVFEFGLSRVCGTSSLLLPTPVFGGQSMSHSFLVDQVFVRARSPSDVAKQSEQDILASLELTAGKVSTVARTEATSKGKFRLVFSFSDLQFHVPRSALRLYRFIQEWRADFLPGIEATVHALLSELQRTPTKPISPLLQRASLGYRSFQIQGQVTHIGVSLQVMHGTWLSWEADRTVSYISSSSSPTSEYAFGLQVTSVTVSIASKANITDGEPSSQIKLILPPLSATGDYTGNGIETIVLVDFIELKVKPSHWDMLLVVQQKFGQDFHDLVTLIQETNIRQATSQPSRPSEPQVLHSSSTSLKYSTFLKIRGFRVGLEGPASTMYLECLDIGGGVNNFTGLRWNVDLSDLAFSLQPRATVRPDHPGFNRNHCSAFVIINFAVDASDQPFESTVNTFIEVSITKIHAVVQPSSTGEVGDFIDHLQAEMLSRQEQRASELTAFKEKTRRILQTFEVGTQDTQSNSQAWFENYVIHVSTRNIGVAFPLTHDQDLQIPQTGSIDSAAVPAFLWSIKSITFGTHRGQTGQALMKNFSFQFISRFRQSIPNDFSGENHVTRNRLVYPEMEAQLRSTRSITSRHIWLGANVSGFILDLDSNIPSYVFSLIDVYRQGKDRMDRLSSNLPRTPSTTESENDLEKVPAEPTQRHTTLPTSSLFATFMFLSGKVRVYSGAASKQYRTKAYLHHHQEPSDNQVMEMGAEVFNLPIVSVWAEYHATPLTQKYDTTYEPEPSILMFKSTVHSSQNTLRPTLLPFLTELVSHIEVRLRRVSLQIPRPASTTAEDVSTAHDQAASDPVMSMRISFSLRIDQSKLELTCQPDVNVIAGLHWDSGGFVVNVSPGARKVTFTGSVGGLTLGLKHGFLSEDCVKLDARNLAFSVTFAKVEAGQGIITNSMTVILDTEFLGVVRFSRLQDILCFKAVWLDRIPVFNSQGTIAKTPIRSSASTPTLSQPREQFTTIVLVRIRQITLDIDLGQSISAMTLDLNDAVMRTKLTDVSSELSVYVADLFISAKGNVAGYARVPNCVFQTIRCVESHSKTGGRNRMLELSMTSGPLLVSLESDHQKLLHYRAEPLEVKIFDDWSVVVPQPERTKPLQLSFTVTSPEIVAVATVGTIPKLLAYVNKFKVNVDAQRLGASRESKAFRVTRTPKPDNPLSAVAEAMLNSARSRFKEAETGLNYVIMQHMSLQLDLLRLVVFPRTMDDLEIAQFVGRDVRARLDRVVESEATASGKRDLLLSFSSMTISKFTGLGHPQATDPSDGREWLTSLLNGAPEAIIVGLPSMTMHMISEEKMEELALILVYDFHSEFVRQEGSREFKDIYITLNVSLYSWLTILRKNLAREMDQVKATTDWRALLNTTSSPANVSKKKVPEPLTLSASSARFSTMPSPLSRPFSPFSPTTALKTSIGGPVVSPASSAGSPSGGDSGSTDLQNFPLIETPTAKPTKRQGILYRPRSRHIERLTMRQLGEATPDVMHPFFMKKAGFNLEDSLPQYVNEYATAPLEEIMEVLLKLYSRQLLSGNR